MAAYYEEADLIRQAVLLAAGISQAQAFVDGNKRIAFISMVAFLRMNGIAFKPDQAQSTAIILAVAAGKVSEQSLARWIRDNWPRA